MKSTQDWVRTFIRRTCLFLAIVAFGVALFVFFFETQNRVTIHNETDVPILLNYISEGSDSQPKRHVIASEYAMAAHTKATFRFAPTRIENLKTECDSKLEGHLHRYEFVQALKGFSWGYRFLIYVRTPEKPANQNDSSNAMSGPLFPKDSSDMSQSNLRRWCRSNWNRIPWLKAWIDE